MPSYESMDVPPRTVLMKCILSIMSDGSRHYVDTLVPEIVKRMGLDPAVAEVPVYNKESKLRYQLRWAITASKQSGLIEEVPRTRDEVEKAMVLTGCAEGNLPA